MLTIHSGDLLRPNRTSTLSQRNPMKKTEGERENQKPGTWFRWPKGAELCLALWCLSPLLWMSDRSRLGFAVWFIYFPVAFGLARQVEAPGNRIVWTLAVTYLFIMPGFAMFWPKSRTAGEVHWSSVRPSSAGLCRPFRASEDGGAINLGRCPQAPVSAGLWRLAPAPPTKTGSGAW